MKVVILCGGRGTRLLTGTGVKPKPLFKIGSIPILVHIMNIYSKYGFNEFVLCLGFMGEAIRKYFLDYEMLSNDFTIEIGTGKIDVHRRHLKHNWKITMVDTGRDAMTGARVKRIEKYIDGDRFMLTYGDGVTDLNIAETLKFHESHGKIGTLTGVSPPSRYGELLLRGDKVLSFNEKPQIEGDSINGGYFIFEKAFFDYLDDDDGCVLEREPLEKLAAADSLRVFKHDGFWQCMDTPRDYKFLNELYVRGNVPWEANPFPEDK